MKTPSVLRSPLAQACALAAMFVASPVQAAGPKAYQFTADGTNTSGDTLTIDHPALNGKSKFKPIVTQNFVGVYNPHPIGVSYDAANGRWRIENEDNAAIPLGSGFNVLIAPAKQTSCTPANTFANRTFFQLQKNKPAGRFLVTHMINPVSGIPGTNCEQYVGTWFSPVTTPATPYSGRWTVYTEDETSLGTVAFNIADVTKRNAGGAPASFVFTAGAADTVANQAVITDPLTDGNPDAVVFATHVFINGTSPTFLDKPLGVWYNGAKWTVFTQDVSIMPDDVSFVVAVIPTATP